MLQVQHEIIHGLRPIPKSNRRKLLAVSEPSLVTSLNDLLSTSKSSSPSFLHVIGPGSAPRALVEGSSALLGGLPSVACCATVTGITPLADGGLEIAYTGTKRVQLLNVQQRGAGPLACKVHPSCH